MTRVRAALGEVGDRVSAELSPVQLLVCAGLLLGFDTAYQHSGSSFLPGGFLDEPAHLLTALLMLQLVPRRLRRAIALPALVGSVAIDLDHIPQYLGWYGLTVGTPRPYTHSLLTIAMLVVLALAVRRHRNLFAGLALGVALHFFRDMAEGNGSGVALLWPLTDRAFSYQHATYLALMACVVGGSLCLAMLRPRVTAAAP